MALVENTKPKAMEEKKDEANEIYYRAYPDMRRRIKYKEKIVEIEVSMPGVKKENITLKVLPTWFHLQATRGHMEYNANQAFGRNILPNKTEAKYDNGLLKIVAHIKDPMAEAKQVQL
jgi:HSP20 family molecular chaperone IbpA